MFYYASIYSGIVIALCHSIPLSKAMWHSIVSPLQTGLSPANKRPLPLLERLATTPREFQLIRRHVTTTLTDQGLTF